MHDHLLAAFYPLTLEAIHVCTVSLLLHRVLRFHREHLWTLSLADYLPVNIIIEHVSVHLGGLVALQRLVGEVRLTADVRIEFLIHDAFLRLDLTGHFVTPFL